MSNIEIKQLYNHNRFPENVNEILYLVFYAPIGIILLALRTILGLCVYLLSYVLPDNNLARDAVRKLVCFTFGIVIEVENPQRKEDVEVFVSNQVSMFDSIAVHFATRSVTSGIKLNLFLSSALGFKQFGSTNFHDFKRNVGENKTPLFFQPESVATNGEALLKFNTWPFSIFNKVQPLTINVRRPGIEIPISTFESGYLADAFFFMFVPCTIYKLKYLRPVERDDSSESDYCERVRRHIADELKVELTNYSAADLKEFKKRYKAEQQRSRVAQQTLNPSVNPELHRMTMQVREVLPHVPYNVVYKDLAKTRSVDITITNVLEGHLQFIPEQPKPSTSRTTTTQTSSIIAAKSDGTASPSCSTHSVPNTAATSFGKSPHERTLSFQERKKELIDSARKRYIEKHGLNIAGS